MQSFCKIKTTRGMSVSRLTMVLFAVLFPISLLARGLPLKAARTIKFETNETTWASLDVSPEGSGIFFDIQGDLYQVPLSGGRAKPLTRGIEWDAYPLASPDGAWIAFS